MNSEINGRTDLTIWYCNGCEKVHLAADGVRLTFTRPEYSLFTRLVVEAHYDGWSNGSVRSLAADQVDIDAHSMSASIEFTH